MDINTSICHCYPRFFVESA